jgi:hypothetical protein
LVTTRFEFLGAVLDLTKKSIGLGKKVINKLATVWKRQREWSVRDFIVTVCILVYTANLLGRRMGKWQKVLQTWAKLQGECMYDRQMMDASIDLTDDVILLLVDWVLLTLDNEDVPVPKGKQEHDFLLICDASSTGLCGIIVSTRTGQTTVVRRTWPYQHDRLKESTTAEPLCVAVAINTFFLPTSRSKVLVISDNTPAVGEVTKGYGTKEGRFLAQHLATHFPDMEVDGEWYYGAGHPADNGSRQLALDRAKLDALAEAKAFMVTDIREIEL